MNRHLMTTLPAANAINASTTLASQLSPQRTARRDRGGQAGARVPGRSRRGGA